MVKYRVYEVARDFKVPTKTINAILAQYAVAPKNHMQVLTDEELNIVFDYFTINNQVESIEKIFELTSKSQKEEAKIERKTEAAKKTEDAKAKSASQESGNEAAAKKRQTKKQKPAKEQQKEQQKHASPDEKQPGKSYKKPEKRIIDTRGATVNIAKYDERLEQFVPDRLANVRSGKQKIKRSQDRRSSIAAGAKRRQEQREKLQKLQLEKAKKQPLKVIIPDEISVGELASRMKKTGAEVVKQLIKMGTMASLSDIIDYDTAALVAMDMGCQVEREVVLTIEERLIDTSEDDQAALEPRSPVVVVMGHVDHGKTSLLDRIRNAHVAEGEAGGITQHIGAYQVGINGKPITFLDTPGHEAFTSMRARGAMVTDIAVLVVAADDGIMPQTIEAINHAKAAEIPIIVAINKIDKSSANPERIMRQLAEHELVSEEWGGDTIVCQISAKTGQGIDNLLEMIVLTAEMRELKANPNRRARGTVIEARLDKGRGPVATVLVQNGTLNKGDIIIAGTAVGRVRTMTNSKGEKLTSAGPSVPVEITGLNEAPGAGDVFNAVEDERMARELAEQRRTQSKQTEGGASRKVTLEDLFNQIREGEIKELAVIVKADVQGSAEAIKASLEKLSHEEVRVRVIHDGVGAITESDVMLASTANAIVVGFNVRPDQATMESAARAGVDIRLYRVIYECIEEIEAAMKGLLAPKFKEVVIGHAEVRKTYKASKIGVIAGLYVQDGKIQRNANVRIIRDGVVVHEGEIASLKRFKDDTREVLTGYECGLTVDKFNDIKEGDIVEAFIMERIQE
jgi:translation initiation factor IF-2